MLQRKISCALCIVLFVISCKKDDNSAPPIEPTDNLEIIISEEVQLNPSGYAPLSAIIQLETKRGRQGFSQGCRTAWGRI